VCEVRLEILIFIKTPFTIQTVGFSRRFNAF
jgi:hypothetical protein